MNLFLASPSTKNYKDYPSNNTDIHIINDKNIYQMDTKIDTTKQMIKSENRLNDRNTKVSPFQKQFSCETTKGYKDFSSDSLTPIIQREISSFQFQRGQFLNKINGKTNMNKTNLKMNIKINSNRNNNSLQPLIDKSYSNWNYIMKSQIEEIKLKNTENLNLNSGKSNNCSNLLSNKSFYKNLRNKLFMNCKVSIIEPDKIKSKNLESSIIVRFTNTNSKRRRRSIIIEEKKFF